MILVCCSKSNIWNLGPKVIISKKNKEMGFLIQIGIFILDPLRAVYVVDLMSEVHPLLPPPTCEELGPVPSSSMGL